MKIAIDGSVRAYDVDGRGVATLASLLHYAEDSRLALAMDLHTRDVAYPLRNLARAQHVVIATPLPMLASFRATSFVARVGGTSFDVVTELERDGVVAVTVVITFVAVDEAGKKTDVSPRMQEAVVESTVPRGPGVAAPFAAPMYERTYPVLPRDENFGRHVSHARLVEHASEHLRVAASVGALDASADAQATSMSIVYERETHFPDRMTVAIGGAEHAFDVALSLADGPLVARARFVTRRS